MASQYAKRLSVRPAHICISTGQPRRIPILINCRPQGISRSEQKEFQPSFHQARSLLVKTAEQSSLSSNLASASSLNHTKSTRQGQSASFDERLRNAASILDHKGIPTAQEIQHALATCENVAENIVGPIEYPTPAAGSQIDPTSDLLSLDRQARPSRRPPMKAAATSNRTVKHISELAYQIIAAPKIFITPEHLATYVKIQTLLGLPESLPAVFDLYAFKPVPKPGTSPVQFEKGKWKAASAAIPQRLADGALTSAIQKRDLALCLSIIDTTVCTPAYIRAKFIRRALAPVAGLTLSPLAAYAIASQISQLPGVRDPDLIFNMATVGLIAYVGFTAITGFVAITTANDQMDRVTWMIGTPLRERWTREEERAMLDRVAIAWGFKSREKRGEEEGENWQHLRRWIMSRGMILDKPELMEGME